jgi:hypothetical protein
MDQVGLDKLPERIQLLRLDHIHERPMLADMVVMVNQQRDLAGAAVAALVVMVVTVAGHQAEVLAGVLVAMPEGLLLLALLCNFGGKVLVVAAPRRRALASMLLLDMVQVPAAPVLALQHHP